MFLGLLLFIFLLTLVGIYIGLTSKPSKTSSKVAVSSYEDCVKADKSTILLSSPEQCVVNGKTFVNSQTKTTESTKTTTGKEYSALEGAYTAKNGACQEPGGGSLVVKKLTANGWAELSVGCEPGSGHIEVWHKQNNDWAYVIGFQDGPFCSMVIDKQISKELYATCITTEPGPTSTSDQNGNPTIPNQIP
jgi:hypothetical protein